MRPVRNILLLWESIVSWASLANKAYGPFASGQSLEIAPDKRIRTYPLARTLLHMPSRTGPSTLARRILKNPLRRFFRNHKRGRVGVATGDGGHDSRINHTQACDQPIFTAHPKA